MLDGLKAPLLSEGSVAVVCIQRVSTLHRRASALIRTGRVRRGLPALLVLWWVQRMGASKGTALPAVTHESWHGYHTHTGVEWEDVLSLSLPRLGAPRDLAAAAREGDPLGTKVCWVCLLLTLERNWFCTCQARANETCW